jgi:LPS export ABC transporter protein LptC
LNINIINLKVRNLLLCVIFLLSISGCQKAQISPEQTSPAVNRAKTSLVLNNAILEQSNDRDNTIWKIKADNIVYSEDKQNATLKTVIGNLLQDGETILEISAKAGFVKDNGNIIFLRDEIIARDTRNGTIVRSNNIEWRPQENVLLISQDSNDTLNGTHPNLEVTAAAGKYFTDIESLELEGEVVATTDKPALQLTSDRVIWSIPQDIIKSKTKLEIVRYQSDKTITDRLVADRAQLNLAENTAILNNNIELISLDPKLQIATESLTWNYENRIGNADKPIQIIDRDRQLSITGNQGRVDLQQQVVNLEEGVQGINQKNLSQLYAHQLMWNITSEELEATGNVVYEQAEPKINLTGDKAVGTLGDNNIVVTSDGNKQVTSIIDN